MAFLAQALPRVMGAPLVAQDQVAGHPRAPRKWSLRASPRKETRTSRSAKGEASAEDPERKAAARLGGDAGAGPLRRHLLDSPLSGVRVSLEALPLQTLWPTGVDVVGQPRSGGQRRSAGVGREGDVLRDSVPGT